MIEGVGSACACQYAWKLRTPTVIAGELFVDEGAEGIEINQGRELVELKVAKLTPSLLRPIFLSPFYRNHNVAGHQYGRPADSGTGSSLKTLTLALILSWQSPLSNRNCHRKSGRNPGVMLYQVGSHYPFIETNPQLSFDRLQSYGKRFNRLKPNSTLTPTLQAQHTVWDISQVRARLFAGTHSP